MKKIYIKINWKGKRTVIKAKKGINVEKYNKYKELKFSKEKRKKKEERKKEKRKKQENSKDLQKPNTQAEVYNNKKCDWIYTYTSINKIKTVQQK